MDGPLTTRAQRSLLGGYFYPNPEGWKGGDRSVLCYHTSGDGTELTRSLNVATP
ncbi:MAG TPA: hypothetical protein VKA85_12185 [Candidatus Limnocylindrales bacterium]|nr:hypothetical protein [Candidatus Limnocylindrales bacterium]